MTESARASKVKIVVCLLVPLLAFIAFLGTFGNATEALAVADGLPLLWVLAYAVWRRRIERLGAVAVAGFGVALLLTVVLGGGPRPLELHRAIFPGAVGLACLISIAIDRPLAVAAATRRRRTAPLTTGPKLPTTGARQALRVLTALVGVTLTADAAVQVTLAFTVSASTFGVVAHIASWAIIGTGVGIGALYTRRAHVRL